MKAILCTSITVLSLAAAGIAQAAPDCPQLAGGRKKADRLRIARIADVGDVNAAAHPSADIGGTFVHHHLDAATAAAAV